MKKVVRLLVIFALMVSIPSFSYAKTYNKNEISNGSYVIGTYLFNKEKTANYNGTLTTQMIMLASKSISNNLSDMKIYFKNSRGKWVNAITGASENNVPNTFEITCVNLNCQNIYPATTESFETFTSSGIGNGSYIIGAYEFNKEKTANYNGTLTTQMIMLAAKSIQSNNLNDMVIYYKNSRGKWVNAINNISINNAPSTFNISYINLAKKGPTKQDDVITIVKKSVNYDGSSVTALVNTKSGLEPTIEYYSDNTCQTKMTSLPINAGTYYIKATPAGNTTYNQAIVNCSEAIEIKKLDAVCPSIYGYTGNYDKTAHTIIVSDAINGTIEYKTTGDWSSLKPDRTDAGTTTVYVRVKGNLNYNDVDCGSKDITITKVQDIVSVLKQSYKYDGTEKTPFMNAVSGLPIVATYYSDEYCQVETTTEQANYVGGAPITAGKYYVRASTIGNENYIASTPMCWEAVMIGNEKFDDEIYVHFYENGKPYTGSGISPNYETASGIDPIITYYVDSTCQTKTNLANSGTAVEGDMPVNIGTYYVTGTTTGNDDFNATSLACTKALIINPRNVLVVAPTLNSDDLTYNGENQVISSTAGSCSAGGTMYYYYNYKTEQAPAFNTTDWSTTYPTIEEKDAGTYNLWYYCKVDDTTNNTGTNINTVLYVTKEILKAINPLTIVDNQSINVTYSLDNQSSIFELAKNGEGEINYSIISQKNGDNDTTYFNISNANEITIDGATPVGIYDIVLTVVAAGNSNYNSISKNINLILTINN